MKRTIIFKIAYIRHEGKLWKFYPNENCQPIAVKDSLINRERIPTAGQMSCKLYLSVDNDLITGMRVDYYNLWEYTKGDKCNLPILPEAYRITGRQCAKKHKHEDNECCSCCPWCQHLTPAGYMKLDYPSENYVFTVKTRK